MAFDQALIDRGGRLHRLMQNEDFGVLLQEWDERLDSLKVELDRWDETPERPAASLTRIVHRLHALQDLRLWVVEEIRSGGAEKMRQEAEAATKFAATLTGPQGSESTQPSPATGE